MRRFLPLALGASVLSASAEARAEEARAEQAAAEATASGAVAPAPDPQVPEDFPRLILDAGRRDFPKPEDDAIRFNLHGEHQVRYQVQRTFPMEATASSIAGRPGLKEDSTGQNQSVMHWLRLTPHFQVRDKVEIVGQLDLLTGQLFGETSHGVDADTTPRNDYDGFGNIQFRWLYAQALLPFGLVRIGQQPNHWGMGILANDGDHPSLFGDYRYGSISERILFATKPAGKDSDFYVALAGDLVYRDNQARLTRGDHAIQGVLAAFYEKDQSRVGLFSTLRHQTTDKSSDSPGSSLYAYTDQIDAFAIDLHGRLVGKVAGDDAFVFGEAEAATILGSTNELRTVDQAATGQKTDLRSYGGAATVGVMHRSWAKSRYSDAGNEASARAASAKYLGKEDPRGISYGDLVAQVEVGYASGDADPYDGTERRFTFDPNHKVGLLLFDEMLRWQTARAATAAADPLLTNAQRPTPGANLLPSNGGVFGAEYINPTVIVRPRHWLDIKGGMVIAQTTADLVDPYRLATKGSYVNYRGGDPKKKDLGLEFDAGFETRFPLDYDFLGQIGAQAGLLLPGTAFEDANGVRLPPQWLVQGRLGLQF